MRIDTSWRPSKRDGRGHAAGALAAALIALPVAAAAPLPLSDLKYSADIGANIVGPGQFAARRDYVLDNLAGARTRVTIAGLPDRANLRDFQLDANGDLLFCLDVGVTLGGTYFRTGDVIKYAGSVYSKAFDATGAGVPSGVGCDGVARSGTAGNLLLSFDRGFSAGGVYIRPADVIAWTGTAFGAKLLDAAALGLPPALNVDAIDTASTTTDLLLSFDTGGHAGGVTFADEDILQLHLSDSSWSKPYTLLNFSDRWGAANLDGLAATNDTIFKNGFE
jgi:hypothetical protein